jgi:hypothetical protein
MSRGGVDPPSTTVPEDVRYFSFHGLVLPCLTDIGGMMQRAGVAAWMVIN